MDLLKDKDKDAIINKINTFSILDMDFKINDE